MEKRRKEREREGLWFKYLQPGKAYLFCGAFVLFYYLFFPWNVMEKLDVMHQMGSHEMMMR